MAYIIHRRHEYACTHFKLVAEPLCSSLGYAATLPLTDYPADVSDGMGPDHDDAFSRRNGRRQLSRTIITSRRPMVVLLQAIAVIGAKGFIATEEAQRGVSSDLLNSTSTKREFTTAHASNYTAPAGACGVAHNGTAVAGYVGSATKLFSTSLMLPQASAAYVLLLAVVMAIAAVLAMVGCMRPRSSLDQRLSRIPPPPQWNPESPSTITFRTWVQRVMVWCIIGSDISESVQFGMLIESLGGSARRTVEEYAMSVPTDGFLAVGRAGHQHIQGPVTQLILGSPKTMRPQVYVRALWN